VRAQTHHVGGRGSRSEREVCDGAVSKGFGEWMLWRQRNWKPTIARGAAWRDVKKREMARVMMIVFILVIRDELSVVLV
jgi:hypothetical protein